MKNPAYMGFAVGIIGEIVNFSVISLHWTVQNKACLLSCLWGIIFSLGRVFPFKA
jgi:hypothetical protein